MISQGAVEQNSWVSGYSRLTAKPSGRILETNTENLLRMVLDKPSLILLLVCSGSLSCQPNCFQVSYCENDVDCPYCLLIFGEKFDGVPVQNNSKYLGIPLVLGR